MTALIRRFCEVVSVVMHPMLIPTYAIAFLVGAYKHYHHDLNLVAIAILFLTTLILTCFLPASLVIYLRRKGEVSSLQMSDAKERRWPYFYGFISCLMWIIFLYKCGMPMVVVYGGLGAACTLFMIWIINYWWKISAHLSCFGCLLGAVTGWQLHYGIFDSTILLCLLGFSLLLMYVRIYLRAHTVLQTVCGFVLGLSISFSITSLAF